MAKVLKTEIELNNTKLSDITGVEHLIHAEICINIDEIVAVSRLSIEDSHVAKYNNGSPIVLSVEPCTTCIDKFLHDAVEEAKEPLFDKIEELKRDIIDLNKEIQDMDIRNI